jgi:hypothetical protein
LKVKSTAMVEPSKSELCDASSVGLPGGTRWPNRTNRPAGGIPVTFSSTLPCLPAVSVVWARSRRLPPGIST